MSFSHATRQFSDLVAPFFTKRPPAVGVKGAPVRIKGRGQRQPAFEALESRQLMSASVLGVVYNDLNVNNTIKPADPGLAGVRVYADLGNHHAYTAGDPTAISNSQGAYTLSGLSAGSYTLREVVPAHFRQTEPTSNAGHSVTLTSTTHLTGVNFGDTQKVRLSGYVFDDANGNAAQDNGEIVAGSVTVYLDANGNKQLDAGELHTTTDATGYWVIGDLTPGKTYTARVAAPAGFIQADPTSNSGHVVAPAAGQTADSLLFGIRPSTVIFNSELRAVEANGGSLSSSHVSTKVGVFDSSATVLDTFGNGGTANLTSHFTATTITALGSLSAVGASGQGFDNVDVTFTLSASTAFSTGYDVFGNNFSFVLKKLNNFGDTNIINNANSNDSSVTSYPFSTSGTLAAGKYELIFGTHHDQGNALQTNSFVMNFNI